MAVWEAKAPCTLSFESLRIKMLKLFDRSLQGDMAAAELVRLNQGNNSVSDYSIRFKTLATSSGWNDAALLVQFLDGLKSEIQDDIASHDLPVSLEAAIELALRVETRHRQRSHRQSFRQYLTNSLSQESSHTPSFAADGEPMQLGRLRLTSRERQHRLSNGLCLYCGKPGHMAVSCPVKGSARR